MKQCFKCKEIKPLSSFYVHKQMGDGYLGKCKECTKQDTKQNTLKNKDYYKEYDKKRAMLPHRIEKRRKYLLTEEGKKARYKATKKYRENNIEHYTANTKVSNAIRDGKLKKLNVCMICGKTNCRIHAHHYDYSKPLEITWICSNCHYRIHHFSNKK